MASPAAVLEVLAECRHPVSIVTKTALVERDLDLLAPMARTNLVRVYVSVTTLDSTAGAKLEPRATAPQRRLATMRALSQAGVPVGVMVGAGDSDAHRPANSRRSWRRPRRPARAARATCCCACRTK